MKRLEIEQPTQTPKSSIDYQLIGNQQPIRDQDRESYRYPGNILEVPRSKGGSKKKKSDMYVKMAR